MKSCSQKTKQVRAGAVALLLALSLATAPLAAYADDAVLPDPITVTVPPVPSPPAPAEPAPVEPAPADPAPVEPAPVRPPEVTVPSVEAPPAVTPPPSSVVPAAPLPAPQRPPAGIGVQPGMAPVVPLPVVPLPGGQPSEEATSTAEATPSPSLEPVLPTAKTTSAAVAEPPAIVTAEIQAAVATATGSPLYIQIVTVLILLGLGFAYFRFLGGKSRGLTSRAGK